MYVYNYVKIFVVHRIRLVGGPNIHIGRVEVYTNSTGGLDDAQWGTVCDNNWDIQDARVVCRQLGYPDAVADLVSAHHIYGPGTGPIWLDNVQCLGTEPDLITCGHNGIGIHNCEHNKDVLVKCEGTYISISDGSAFPFRDVIMY